MIYAALLFFGIAFLELFLFFRIAASAGSIISRSRESVAVLMSPDLDDQQKEDFVRRGSVVLFKATGAFILKFVAVFAVLYIFFLLLIVLVPSIEEPLLQSFVSPVSIVGLTLAVMIYAGIRNVIRKQLRLD